MYFLLAILVETTDFYQMRIVDNPHNNHKTKCIDQAVLAQQNNQNLGKKVITRTQESGSSVVTGSARLKSSSQHERYGERLSLIHI